jgi:hypothetical protein
MEALLLRRLVRAIAEGRPMELHDIAKRLVTDEEKRGHDKVAEDLRRILKTAVPAPMVLEGTEPAQGLARLPVNKRTGANLAVVQHFDALRSDMVLPAGVEARFKRIEQEFAARERLATYGFRPKKKILLYGPPGCGKTLGAERLAANLRMPLVRVRFDAVVSSYLGETASNLRAVFDLSKGSEPRVLLLDECDFIAKSRTDTRDVGEMARVVNTLLLLLDEYDAPGMLIATTNLHEALDPAIHRRFDDAIEIPRPGPDEQQRLLKSVFKQISVGKGFSWSRHVSALAGKSAADIVRVGEEAAKLAIMKQDEHLLDRHMTEALELAGIQ